MKTCTKCLESKPETEFYVYGRSGALMAKCKACHRAAAKTQWRDIRGPYAKLAAAMRPRSPTITCSTCDQKGHTAMSCTWRRPEGGCGYCSRVHVGSCPERTAYFYSLAGARHAT